MKFSIELTNPIQEYYTLLQHSLRTSKWFIKLNNTITQLNNHKREKQFNKAFRQGRRDFQKLYDKKRKGDSISDAEKCKNFLQMPSAIKEKTWSYLMEKHHGKKGETGVRELREWDKMEQYFWRLYFTGTSRYKILKDVGYTKFWDIKAFDNINICIWFKFLHTTRHNSQSRKYGNVFIS